MARGPRPAQHGPWPAQGVLEPSPWPGFLLPTPSALSLPSDAEGRRPRAPVNAGAPFPHANDWRRVGFVQSKYVTLQFSSG